MDKQIKRLLLAELSSKRKLAKSLNEKLPATVTITRSKDSNDKVVSFYMLYFDEYNIFHFGTWMRGCMEPDYFDFYLKERKSYTINDLKQELKLADVWFEPFINKE